MLGIRQGELETPVSGTCLAGFDRSSKHIMEEASL
jgi:hypothetical protein